MQATLNFDAAEQRANLTRVGSKTAGHINHWLAVHKGEQFHVADLLAYVQEQGERVAPASVDRVMRDLRQRGEVGYTVVSRRHSLYLSEGVRQ